MTTTDPAHGEVLFERTMTQGFVVRIRRVESANAGSVPARGLRRL